MLDPPTVNLLELVAYLDHLLDARSGNDVCPNGLQVEGRQRVRKVVTGVSACHELFAAARERQADAVLVHHGIFWRGDSPVLRGVQYRRVAELVRGELSLLAYHLPLDRHSELGNNALAARALGLEELTPFGILDDEEWGFRGRFAEPVEMAVLARRCQELFGGEPLVFAHGPDPVHTVGVVSGGAQRVLSQAIDAGLDLFLTGEVSEWVMNLAREAGIHFVAAGHYATERLGVQALGEHLADRFGIEVEFVDIPNPV
jgi:dinuclear metal center YbgI/SA1388 family protein